jgi:hypothetical protein
MPDSSRRGARTGLEQLGPGASVRVSIDSIIRGLAAAIVVSSFTCAFLVLVGRREIAVPFALATAIEFGLLVVGCTWRALTRAHRTST